MTSAPCTAGRELGVAAGAITLRLGQAIAPQADGLPSLTAFHIAFVVVGLIALAGVTDALTLDRSAGAGLGGGAGKKG